MSTLAPQADAPRLRSFWRGGAAVVLGAAVAGLAAGEFVVAGRTPLVFSFALLLLPVLIWKRPWTAPVIVVAAALTIEQFPEIVGSRHLALTAHLPLFHGLGGYRPSDLLLLMLVTMYFVRRGSTAVVRAPRTELGRLMQWLLGAVIFAVVLGVGTGGIARVALTEARPFLYTVAAYVVASTFVTTRDHVHAMLWALIAGSGFKAIQELTIFLSVRHVTPRPDAILGHEESLFFGIFVLLTLGLWLYDLRGRLRTTATWLLPVVLAADLTNGRRTAWLILPVAVIIAIAVGIVALPARRRFLSRFALVLLVLSSAYFPAYWHKTGRMATPARAFRSAISPDPRDASSDLYRIQEDANLRLNIRMASPLGRGFGHPIDYALPIVNISSVDPYIAYIPHNGVWWLFLRLGTAGAAVFWALLGVGIITACRLARTARDKLYGVVGMLLACALPSYLLLGYSDQGFFYYRVGFVVGGLLGLLEASRRLAQTAAVPVPVPARERVAVRPSAVRAPRTVERRAPRARLRVPLPRFGPQIVAVAGLPVALVLLAVLATGRVHPATTTLIVSQPAPAHAAPAAAKVERKPAPLATLAIAAPAGGRGSWIQVRRGSKTGTVLFDGVVRDGALERFKGRRIWVRFGAAANLDVSVDGRPVRLFGTVDTAFSRGKGSS